VPTTPRGPGLWLALCDSERLLLVRFFSSYFYDHECTVIKNPQQC
jgi:hypothetical protein